MCKNCPLQEAITMTDEILDTDFPGKQAVSIIIEQAKKDGHVNVRQMYLLNMYHAKAFATNEIKK